MDRCVLGIDLGTSSVKIVKKYADGHIQKLKNTYKEPLPEGWWQSILILLEQINWKEVSAIGLSSQVGTYLVNNKEVIGWNSHAGRKEVKWWKANYTKETFLKEISMPHPDIISYPLPRLKYIKEHFERIEKICQPKEYILEKLTGEWVTDAYSWRGLVNLETKEYSKFFLQELFIEEEKLPPIKKIDEIAGYTKEIRFENNILPLGIPVYTGLNDYYAGLLGMGMNQIGQMFDVTGTSEHLGVLQGEVDINTSLVSGPYIEHMVHYGVTASSGPSIKFGLKLMQNAEDNQRKTIREAEQEKNKDAEVSQVETNKTLQTVQKCFELDKIVQIKPPVFLPYLKGERAPIWNPDARGVFFGMEEGCDEKCMTYSVMEGVVFSLYHIYETMGKPEILNITVSGGAAQIDCLNQLKAEIFNIPIKIVKESDVSALGACMAAAVGSGLYQNYEEAGKEWIKISKQINPTGKYKEWFQKRFEIYKDLYLSTAPIFEKWKSI